MDEAAALLARARECVLAADTGRAEVLLRQLIALDPSQDRAYELLGKLLYRDSRTAEAAAVYRTWLQASPTDPVAAHLVAATSGIDAPERASDGFLASVFDRAASDFDSTLAKLNYRAPQLVFERTMEVLDPSCVGFDMLDLGCGTGLCAEWFRPLARRIVGVDLSPEMIRQAHSRGCYDELICDEITAFAARCTERFDLVTAADVFCYFGDLNTAVAALARLLRSNALFTFSVEALPGEDGLLLLEHGRYAHSKSHLERAVAQAGLTCALIAPQTLRFERGVPVKGLIAVAKRP